MVDIKLQIVRLLHNVDLNIKWIEKYVGGSQGCFGVGKAQQGMPLQEIWVPQKVL